MKRERMERVIAEMLDLEAATLWRKNADYAADVDVVANFKRHAEQLGLSPFHIWAVYAGKHWDAVMAYCKNGKVESEAIEMRVNDLRVYLILLRGLLEDAG